MTTMKAGRYYIYNGRYNDEVFIKITEVVNIPSGCMYGKKLRYKIYCDTTVSGIGLLYATRYYWDKFAREITKEEAMIHVL